ncbi:MAG TPA: hypothetical protein PLK55_03525 [archaeon]|jgi:hypothetical protein|nr:hypothetical protein [archaeon]
MPSLKPKISGKRIILKKPIERKIQRSLPKIPEKMAVKIYERRYAVSAKDIQRKLDLFNRTLKESKKYSSYEEMYKDILKDHKKQPSAETKEFIRTVEDLRTDRLLDLKNGRKKMNRLLEIYSHRELLNTEFLLYAGYKPIELATSLAVYDMTMRKAGLERYIGDSETSQRTRNPKLNNRNPKSFIEAPGYEGFVKNHINWDKVIESLRNGTFRKTDFKVFFSKESLSLINNNI